LHSEKHYSSGVKGRQERLEADARKAWPSDLDENRYNGATIFRDSHKTSINTGDNMVEAEGVGIFRDIENT
jgi:hypothetical protein